MSSTTALSPEHPIVEFTARASAALARLTGVGAWSLSPAEQASVVVELAQVRAGVDELWLRVLAAADRNDVAAGSGASSTTAWLAHATTTPPGAAHADVRLATALDGSFAATRAALAAGTIDADRAREVVRAVQALPAESVVGEPELPARAETHLLDLAKQFDARRLRCLGRHLLETLDPQGADERLGARLEAEEARAERSAFLEVHDNGDGTHSGRFKIASLHAAMLTKMLDALSNPARHATGGTIRTGDDSRSGRVSRPEQLGQAFGELLERFPQDHLPTTAGGSATVVVTVDLDNLLTGLGTASLDTGQTISAGQARRLACEAGVIPAVVRRLMDGGSVVLDMGRERRLHTTAMRIALGVQQGGCTADGCTRPPGWCHTHHDTPWAAGGHTSITNGRLLCPHHHRKAHSASYDMTRLPDGSVRFNRRT
jgi:hypothetical protein